MHDDEQNLSLKYFFSSLTNIKVIHIIVILGLIVFTNSLFNGFVWDDISYLLDNAGVQHLDISLQFQQNLFNNVGQYRALTAVYFTMLYGIFGTAPFMYHLVQLLLHMVNTYFVYILFKRFFKPHLSLLLALIFMVHPMQVESVSYISAAGSELFFIFGMFALQKLRSEVLDTYDWIYISFMLFLSMLSKEVGILFVVMVSTYVFLYKKKYIIQSLSFSLGSVIAYLCVRIGIGQVYFETRPLIPIDRLSFAQRLLNVPEVLFYYIKTFIYPMNLSIDQQWVVTSVSNKFFVAISTIIIFCVSLSVFFVKWIKSNREQSKTFCFFLVWTVIGFGMYSQLFPLDMTVADRWIYFPIVGLLGLIGVIVSQLKKNTSIVSYVLILVIALLSVITIIRNTNWYNAVDLYTHDTAIQTNFLVENDFAQHLVKAGDLNDALIHQKKSVELFPYEQNVLNLGNLYEKTGDNVQAKKYYLLALQSNSYIPWQYKHIVFSYAEAAKMYLKEDKPKEALLILNAGIKDYGESGNSGTLWLLLALTEYKLNNLDVAINAAQKASLLLPTQATTDLYTRLQAKEKIDIVTYLNILP